MIINWKDEFAPHILARGHKYFAEGRVKSIQSDGNTYIASVEGTEYYQVQIYILEDRDLLEDRIVEMDCNCPYAKENNCKHMAAVLFALESDDLSVEELPPVKRPSIISHTSIEIPWLEAIDQLPEEVIRKELLKQADRDVWLKERLAVLYLGKLPAGQIQNWRADLQEIAIKYTNRRGKIDDENTCYFLNDLSDFLNDNLPLLIEVKSVMDAFYLIWIVMETAIEWEIDDVYDDLCGLVQLCEEELSALLPLTTDTQRKEMLQWYHDHRNETWPGGVENMDAVFHSLLTE